MREPLYKINKTTLQLEKVKVRRLPSVILLTSFLIFTLFLLLSFHTPLKERYIFGESVYKIENDAHKFSEELFINEVLKYNFRFPEIIIAQAIQESGFNSPIFKDNHNLFGMKEAHLRINVAKGTRRGHAYYDNWRESVLDRALYEEAYLRRIEDKQHYFDFLQKNYAGDPNYITNLKRIITKEKLYERLERKQH